MLDHMVFPEVTLEPDDGLEEAVARVSDACRRRREDLYSLDPLNALSPTSEYCQFFQTRLEERDCVVVVMVQEWSDDALVRVLNTLLELRAEVGARPPLFRFCSQHPIPEVFGTLFDDGPVSEFECRAAPAIRFGTELRADAAFQFATVGMFLARVTFGVRVDFTGADGEAALARILDGPLAAREYSAAAVPLNTLISLGFLYGERQRVRIPFASHWVQLKDLGPWPSVLFTHDVEPAADGESSPDATRRVAFSPISIVLGAFQRKQPGLLEAGASDLSEKCDAEFS